jgi:hypothetical protein
MIFYPLLKDKKLSKSISAETEFHKMDQKNELTSEAGA